MRTFVLLFAWLFAGAAWAADGLVKMKSAHPPKVTLDRLEKLVKEKGMTVFARIDHAAAAAKAGKALRASELLIFGNPEGGTRLMQCAQSAAIDLPMKALVWEDAKGISWIAYNDPTWIARRHRAKNCRAAAELKKALAVFVDAAAAR